MPYGLVQADLGYILGKIRMPPQKEKAISDAGAEVCRFLMDWAREKGGLDLAGILQSGSFVRQTKWTKSDLDIVFWTGQINDKQSVKKELLNRATKRFTNAEVSPGDHAVHVNLQGQEHPEIDIVYTTEAHKIKEKALNDKIYQMSTTKKDAAILSCYALDTFNKKIVGHYEVSMAALQLDEADLLPLVVAIVGFFSSRITRAGFTINQGLTELHKDRFDKVFSKRKIQGKANAVKKNPVKKNPVKKNLAKKNPVKKNPVKKNRIGYGQGHDLGSDYFDPEFDL